MSWQVARLHDCLLKLNRFHSIAIFGAIVAEAACRLAYVVISSVSEQGSHAPWKTWKMRNKSLGLEKS